MIGFFAGNPQLGFMIGSAIGGYLDPAQIEGPRLKDAQVQTSDEGVPRPIIYGVYAVAGNLIQRGPLIERKHTERAGKGGPEQTTYRYFMSYAIRVCEGPVGGILRIWRDDKLVYDVRPGSTLSADTASFATKLTIYLGGESQLPDPTLEALPAAHGGGAGNVPAHRGTCYVVFENDDLTDRNGTIPQYRFEVASTATETPSVCPMAWAISSNAGANAQVLRTQDPTDWSESVEVIPGAVGSQSDTILAGDEMVITWGTVTQPICYSSDNGDTWAEGYTFPSVSGADKGVFAFGKFFIPMGGSGLFITTDGVNVDQVTGWVWDGIVVHGNRLVAYRRGSGTYDRAFYSGDQGQTWQFADGFLTEDGAGFGAPSGSSMASNGSLLAFVYDRGANSIMRISDDSADSWESVTSPFPAAVSGRYLMRYHDEGGWVCVNADGDIAYSANGGSWSLSVDGLGATPNDLSFGNGVWVIVGDGGACMTSADGGATWTSRATSFGAVNLTGVTYLGDMPGTEIPDAPGFYVQEDGSILARCTTVELAADSVILSTVVQDIAERVGLESGQLSLSALTDTLTGYAIARQMPATEALKPLQQVYFFDFPEWDLKLRAVKRGGTIVKTLVDDDFIQTDDDEDVRGQAVEFPRKLNLYHADPDANYARVPAPASRVSQNVKATGEIAIEAPLSLTRAEAAPIADIQMKVAWEELQGTLKRKLPSYAHAELVPSDRIAFDSKTWRITKTEVFEGTLSIEAKRDRASNYGSTATPNSIVDPTTPVSSTKGPTIFQAMNLPSLRSADDEPGIYVAATGLLTGWQGCDLYLSTDGGLSEQLVLRMTARATMGYLLEDITATQDDSNGPIPVRLYDGRELDSITQAQLDARQNAFAMVTDDVSEIAQVETVTEDSNGDYELTDVARGLLGTEAVEHFADDRFVLLDAAVYFLPLDVNLSGQTLILRPVSIGTVPANNPAHSLVFDPPIFIRDGGVVAP